MPNKNGLPVIEVVRVVLECVGNPDSRYSYIVCAQCALAPKTYNEPEIGGIFQTLYLLGRKGADSRFWLTFSQFPRHGGIQNAK